MQRRRCAVKAPPKAAHAASVPVQQRSPLSHHQAALLCPAALPRLPAHPGCLTKWHTQALRLAACVAARQVAVPQQTCSRGEGRSLWRRPRRLPRWGRAACQRNLGASCGAAWRAQLTGMHSSVQGLLTAPSTNLQYGAQTQSPARCQGWCCVGQVEMGERRTKQGTHHDKRQGRESSAGSAMHLCMLHPAASFKPRPLDPNMAPPHVSQ